MPETCKDCRWAVADSPIVGAARTCRGAPPQIVLVPGPRGPEIKQIWPGVGIDHPICGAFAKKVSIIGLDNSESTD